MFELLGEWGDNIQNHCKLDVNVLASFSWFRKDCAFVILPVM